MALSKSQMKKLEKEAAEFARRAKAGRTYYVVAAFNDRSLPKLLQEIQFTKRFGGLVYGSHTPKGAYIHVGPIYEERDHRDIRGMQTVREYYEECTKARDAWVNSPEHSEAMREIGAAAGFRSIF